MDLPEGKKVLRCILLSGTMDAPAKCIFQNFVQFNGFYGCPFCESPGNSVKTSEKGHTHVYPFNKNMPSCGHGPSRTHDKTLEQAKEAEKLKAENSTVTVHGVKGYSWFMFVPGFDIIHSIGIDYMHCVLLGVVKMLTNLWFDKSHTKERWSISSRVSEVDRRLSRIKPPNCISRVVRSISNYLCHWKASEFRSFLFFYGLPCLYNILPEDYFQHFLLLVDAVWLLNQECISQSNLAKSRRLFKHFCLEMDGLYGERYETFNVHCLLHLTKCVENLGPLWTFSCFWYEDFNGDIRKLFHGTQKVDLQVALSVCIQQKIPDLVDLLPPQSAANEFYTSMTSGRWQSRCQRTQIQSSIYALGTHQNVTLSSTEIATIESLVGYINRKSVMKFRRIQIKRDTLHCIEYKAVTQRNSYTIKYKDLDGTIGYMSIHFYLKVERLCPNPLFCYEKCVCKCPVYLALGDSIEVDLRITLSKDCYTGASVDHIIPCRKSAVKRLVASDVCNILDILVEVDCYDSDHYFVCSLPNRIEKD